MQRLLPIEPVTEMLDHWVINGMREKLMKQVS